MRAAATDSTRVLRFFQDKRVLPSFSYIIREASIWCLPEIWIPYGDTETLVTLGAENLGELIEPAQDSLAEEEIERLKGSLAEFSDLVICDRKPPPLEEVKRLLRGGSEGSSREVQELELRHCHSPRQQTSPPAQGCLLRRGEEQLPHALSPAGASRYHRDRRRGVR